MLRELLLHQNKGVLKLYLGVCPNCQWGTTFSLRTICEYRCRNHCVVKADKNDNKIMYLNI